MIDRRKLIRILKKLKDKTIDLQKALEEEERLSSIIEYGHPREKYLMPKWADYYRLEAIKKSYNLDLLVETAITTDDPKIRKAAEDKILSLAQQDYPAIPEAREAWHKIVQFKVLQEEMKEKKLREKLEKMTIWEKERMKKIKEFYKKHGFMPTEL